MTIVPADIRSTLEKLLLVQLCIISISIAAASISLAISIIFLFVLVIQKREWLLLNTPLNYFVAAYIAVEFLSTIFSLSPSDSLHNARRLLLLFLIPITILSFPAEEKILSFLKVLAIVFASISAVEIVLYFYRHNERLYVFQHYMTTGGLKMIVCLLLIPFIVDKETVKKERLFFGLSFLPIFIALILTNTRSAWVGFIIGIGVMGFLFFKKIFIILAIFISLFFLFAPQQQIDRAKSIVDLNDPTNKGRMMMWSTGFEIWKDYPVLGIGDIDIYNTYKNYKSPEDNEPAGHLHNNFMTLLVTLGGAGLAVVSALFVRILYVEYSVFKKWKHVPFARNISLGSLAVFSGFLVNGLFEWNFGDHEIMVFVWFTVGLCFAVNTINRKIPA